MTLSEPKFSIKKLGLIAVMFLGLKIGMSVINHGFGVAHYLQRTIVLSLAAVLLFTLLEFIRTRPQYLGYQGRKFSWNRWIIIVSLLVIFFAGVEKLPSANLRMNAVIVVASLIILVITFFRARRGRVSPPLFIIAFVVALIAVLTLVNSNLLYTKWFFFLPFALLLILIGYFIWHRTTQ